MSLSHYWPALPNIDGCIRTEAETVDPAVLLAVHEAGTLRVRAAEGGAEEIKTEQDLLKELLRPADDGSAVVVAITGASGVGKSHMVRWLHAQLLRHPRRDELVIVVVPKTASLREVVERILESREGGRYQRLRSELSKAIESLTPDHASEMLAAALGNELENKYQAGMQALTSGGMATDRSAREDVASAKGLRDVLRDPTVRDKWFGKVLKRIIRQTLEGGSEAGTGELRRFVPEDLATPVDWDPMTGTLEARRYLQQLQSNDGVRREAAAGVLQDVLDAALRGVFRFSEALGQRTIEEIVGEIRQELLAEGKELVLLIEDFAALAGIQQPLLNLMIAESDYQGERIRAPLRTALAVTDGFLPSRQTILTRAKREWIIPNTAPTKEDVIQRFVELAGRYLNAARWGVAALRDQYRSGADEWLQIYSESMSSEDAETLAAFGKSRRGYPLFPLSKTSIESLCHRELRSGTEVLFNPRAFINRVLRDTLLLRPQYERRAFPPFGFKEAVLAAAAEMGLRQLALSQSVKDRLAPVLVHWAGNPQDLSAPSQVDKGIFKAFDLPWPYHSDQVIRQARQPAAVKTDSKNTRPPKLSTEERPGTPGLVDLLERWANGERLSQAQARQMRIVLATALRERLDWNILRMRATTVDPAHIWLPYVMAGNPTTDPSFKAGEESLPLPANLRAGVLALDRWYVNQRSWDYVGADEDYVLAQKLVDDLEKQAVSWLTTLTERQAAVSVRVLHRQALILRMTKAADPQVPRLADYGLEPPIPPSPDSADNSPAAVVLRACVRASSALRDVRKTLYETIGCFQGVGDKLLAIDAHRLRLAWRAKERPDDPQQLRASGPARDAANELAGVRIHALTGKFRSAIEGMIVRILEIAGPGAETSLAPTLQVLIENARKASLIPSDNFSVAQAKRELEWLCEESAKSHLRRAISFVAPAQDATPHKQLAAWAEWDVLSLQKTTDALTYLDELVQGIEREANAALKAMGGGDIAAAEQRLRADLSSLVSENSA